MAKGDTLNEKETAFCYEYVANKFNGVQAYLDVYDTDDYNTAGVNASKMLKKTKVKNKIAELTKKYFLKADHQAEDIIKELSKLAFSNLDDFVTWDKDGIYVRSSEEIGERSAALKEIEIEDVMLGGTPIGKKYKIKLHDKKGTLELLAKHAKLLTEKHEHSGTIKYEISDKFLPDLDDES